MRKFHAAAILVLLFAGTDEAQARPERMCPMIYRPVCAVNRYGKHQTFANRCIAEDAGAHVRHDGSCRRH